MNKVTLPKKLVEAIESLRTRNISNAKLLNYPGLKQHNSKDPAYQTICNYIYLPHSGTIDEEHLEIYVQAITVGYISDKSPEEKLRDYYDYHKSRSLHATVNAVEKVLELLEIKVKGINS